MDIRRLSLQLLWAWLPLAATAADGLATPPAESLWPQWQARIAVQVAPISALGLSRLLDGGGPQRSWQGAAVLGDYYFATPALGGFRASGGLLFGATGGAPLLSASAGSALGWSLQSVGSSLAPTPSADVPGTWPYLGLGFTGTAWNSALSLTADLGWMADHPSAAAGASRAIFGQQGRDGAWRELRLSPVLQLGLRYSF